MTSPGNNHGLKDGHEYPLRIGTSFQPNRSKESYHLLRYDFKPASVDTSREAEVHIGSNHECTVTIPNVHDAGTTTYKGGRRPCQKECILIIDKETGEITLERISSNMQLKKSRVERSSEINAAKRAEIKNASEKNVMPKTKVKANQHNITATISSSSNATSNTHSALSTMVESQKPSTHTPQPPVHQPQTIKKREKGLSMSTSDSNSSSSESSDSDSGPEDEVEKKNESTVSKDHQSEQNSSLNDTPKPAQINSNSGFMSTLHHDLHLSDSNESDSD